MRTPSDLYRFHCENLRQVGVGLDRTALQLRRAISSADAITEASLLRLYALLLGSWAECRLKKVLYEPTGFNDIERGDIRRLDSQIDRWIGAVERAFRKRFGVSKAPLDPSTLPFAAAARFREANVLLNDQLRPVIELRNKFAHGQWAYLLTNDEEEVSSAQMANFKRENFLSLQIKRDLIAYLAAVVNDLVVSSAFDRDFDYHHKLIGYAQQRLSIQRYEDYCSRIRARRKRPGLRIGCATEDTKEDGAEPDVR